jgi:hypothetical protein
LGVHISPFPNHWKRLSRTGLFSRGKSCKRRVSYLTLDQLLTLPRGFGKVYSQQHFSNRNASTYRRAPPLRN